MATLSAHRHSQTSSTTPAPFLPSENSNHHDLQQKTPPPCPSASHPCTAAEKPETDSAASRVEIQSAAPSGHPHCFRRECKQPPPTTSHSTHQLNTASCSVTSCSHNTCFLIIQPIQNFPSSKYAHSYPISPPNTIPSAAKTLSVRAPASACPVATAQPDRRLYP